MNRLRALGLVGLIGLPLLAAPSLASASCAGRKETGTVVGGVSGAVVGDALTHSAGGLLLGGLGGAVVGHQIGKSGCARVAPRAAAYHPVERPTSAPACHYQNQSYYDSRGVLVHRQVCVR